jgi:heparan-alpha-glucosaminide N-acetyltransferase
MLFWLLASTVLTISAFILLVLGNYALFQNPERVVMKNFIILGTPSISESDTCICWPLGMPFSKPLYTVSYMLLTAGVSGFLLLLLYYIVSFI